MKKIAPLVPAVVVALALLVTFAAPATAGTGQTSVLPPNAAAAGRTDAQWSAAAPTSRIHC
jgi:hypothetical protein